MQQLLLTYAGYLRGRESLHGWSVALTIKRTEDFLDEFWGGVKMKETDDGKEDDHRRGPV